MQRDRRAELLLFVATLIFTAIMLWSASHLKFYIRDTIGPGFYPTFVLMLLGLVTVILLLRLLRQQGIRIITPFPEGLEKDALLRHLCGTLSRQWGYGIRVLNKTGVGRFSAAYAGQRSTSDGRGLVVLTSDTPDLPSWHAASFALAHFEPLVRLYFDPDVLLVRPDAPWMDLAALRKAGPLRVGLAHHPIYSSSLLEWLTGQLGLELRPVFDEDPLAIQRQLHDGTLDAVVLGLGDTRDELAAGRLRGLAAASDEPVTAPAPLPTFAEQGHPLVSGRWAGVLVPKGMDATTRERLEQDLLDGLPLALREPEAQSLMSGLEAEWHVRPAKAFRAFLNLIEDNQRQINPEGGGPELPPGKFFGLVVTIVGVLLFPALMQLVGFPLAAFVFLAGLMALLWPRLSWRALLQILPIALVLAFGLNWVFWNVFYVVFPEGFFTGF